MKKISALLLICLMAFSPLASAYNYENFCQSSIGLKEILANVKCRQSSDFNSCGALYQIRSKSTAEQHALLNMYVKGEIDEQKVRHEVDEILKQYLNKTTLTVAERGLSEVVLKKIIGYIKSSVVSAISEVTTQIASDLTGIAGDKIRLALKLALFAYSYKAQIAAGDVFGVAAGAAYTTGLWYLGYVCPKCMAAYFGVKIAFTPTDMGCGDYYGGLTHAEMSQFVEVSEHSKCMFKRGKKNVVVGEGIVNLLKVETGDFHSDTEPDQERFSNLLKSPRICEYYNDLHKKTFKVPTIETITKTTEGAAHKCTVVFEGNPKLTISMNMSTPTGKPETVMFKKGDEQIGKVLFMKRPDFSDKSDPFFTENIGQFKVYGSELHKCCVENTNVAECNKTINFER